MKYFNYIEAYFKLVVLEHKSLKGFIYKEIETLPIVGSNFYKGYEIINPKTNKVVFRKVKDWGYISGALRINNYKTIKKFFYKNTI